jgi:hypothetical protein
VNLELAFDANGTVIVDRDLSWHSFRC